MRIAYLPAALPRPLRHAGLPAALALCASVLFYAVPAAAATALPDFDIVQTCSHDESPDACQTIEASTRDDLQGKWDSMAERVRKKCAKYGKDNGHSYVAISGCVDDDGG